MVSFKSLTLLAVSASIATAIPQYGHARFHYRALTAGTGVDLTPMPTGGKDHHHHHHHQHNETETGDIVGSSADEEDAAQKPNVLAVEASPCSTLSTQTQYVTSTDITTVTAPARRWDPQHSWSWGGQNSWTQSQAQSSAAPLVSVGVSVGGDATTSTIYVTAGATGTGTGSASSATASAASGSSSGGKKGLSYNSPSLLTEFNAAGASWAYNWGASSGGSIPSGVEYVPMLWGSDGISAWPGAVSTAIANGATHVLSFNEPDFPSQANIPASQAAQLHIENVANLAGQVKIVSPAITNSNVAGQGLDWMTQFLSACGGSANNCKLDALACHWYNNPGTFSDFQSHITAVINLANQNNVPKVWITEFAVNGALSDQADFLGQALPWLDSQSAVERYAYFMVGEGQMLTNGALNAVGNAYVS